MLRPGRSPTGPAPFPPPSVPIAVGPQVHMYGRLRDARAVGGRRQAVMGLEPSGEVFLVGPADASCRDATSHGSPESSDRGCRVADDHDEGELMTTIAIMGANGVYARHLIPRLVAAGHRVRALARRPEAATVAAACGAEVRPADIFDRDQMATALAGCDIGVNLATSLPGP